MKYFWKTVLLIFCFGVGTQASTLILGYGVSTVNNAPQSAAPDAPWTYAPGMTVYVYVFGKTDTLQDPSSNSSLDASGNGFQDESANDDNQQSPQLAAGGIRGIEFNVSNSTDTCTKFTYAPAISNFIEIHGTLTGGQESAYGFADASSYNDTTLGTPDSATMLTSGVFSGYDLLATETWIVGGPSFFTLSTTGTSTYYDSTNGPQNFDSVFSQTVFTTPEPGLALPLFLLLGLTRANRHAG